MLGGYISVGRMNALQALGHRFESDYFHLYIIMKYLILKDRRRRVLYALYERRRIILRALIDNLILPFSIRRQAYFALIQLPRETSITQTRNRCCLTGRPRGMYTKFGLSRLRFRKLAWEGQLAGVKKSSW